MSPRTSSFTSFHPPISLANLKVLNASSDVKHPAVLGKYIIFFGSKKSIKTGFFLFKIFTLLTATVTISAPEALIASAVSLKLLYFPVPTIKRELSLYFPIFK